MKITTGDDKVWEDCNLVSKYDNLWTYEIAITERRFDRFHLKFQATNCPGLRVNFTVYGEYKDKNTIFNTEDSSYPSHYVRFYDSETYLQAQKLELDVPNTFEETHHLMTKHDGAWYLGGRYAVLEFSRYVIVIRIDGVWTIENLRLQVGYTTQEIDDYINFEGSVGDLRVDKMDLESPRPIHRLKRFVIPIQNNINHQAIIDYLKETLARLHYSVYQCKCCDWVDHVLDDWQECHACGEKICHYCYEDLSDGSSLPIYCQSCEPYD